MGSLLRREDLVVGVAHHDNVRMPDKCELFKKCMSFGPEKHFAA
jgi:hypothetical protein